MTQCPGNSTSFPVSYFIPDDGTTAIAASSVNVAFTALGDRTAWLKANRPALQSVLFGDGNYGGSATWVVPVGVTRALVVLAGGGGAGGGGGLQDVRIAPAIYAGGGGGGAASVPIVRVISVYPGDSLAITWGFGGAFGMVGQEITGWNGGDGAAGEDSSIISASNPGTNIVARGALGGAGGSSNGALARATGGNASGTPAIRLSLDGIAANQLIALQFLLGLQCGGWDSQPGGASALHPGGAAGAPYHPTNYPYGGGGGGGASGHALGLAGRGGQAMGGVADLTKGATPGTFGGGGGGGGFGDYSEYGGLVGAQHGAGGGAGWVEIIWTETRI